ncbi:Jag N-terminal domain-containing protein [Helicobacter acinonychis]|uniref:Jag N-terminal domain-containing protein n=1 Tax=Helicobacter acinonychis TaxID=212 RepID=UPI000CF02233|nr:Jag N-terminal domain-containing protein [Helicobacter acinonychis]STP04858.1 spoIIIJ-associated protein [Helicobacter acinonychis]
MQNFIEIKAKTLEEALIQASITLNCPIINLQYEVIQTPSKGFLSIGKKEAIILVGVKESKETSPKEITENSPKEITENSPQKTNLQEADIQKTNQNTKEQKPISEPKVPKTPSKPPKTPPKKELSDEEKLNEITKELKDLFSHLPYKIHKVEVSFYEPGVLLIDIDGEDSALLIGEKGYRYKALSYLLFNWIHPTYGYNIRLEISTFLQNQEKVMEVQLQSVIMTVHEVGKGQMKAPDGVLTYIALKKLRKAFPNKYVSIKTNLNDEKCIVINDFHHE